MPNRIAYAFRNFSKGELSKQVSGRDDTAIYYSSAESLLNGVVRPYGNWVNRAGSHYVASVKEPTEDVRLLKLVVSTTVSYIIECGLLYFRFYTNNGRLVKDETDTDVLSVANSNMWANDTDYSAGTYALELNVSSVETLYICLDDHTSNTSDTFLDDSAHWYALTESDTSGEWIVEVPHTYTITSDDNEIWDLDNAQKDDVLELVQQVHAPARLIRTTPDSFYLTDFNFEVLPWEEFNSDKDKKVKSTPRATSSDFLDYVTITSDFDLFEWPRDEGRVFRLYGTKEGDQWGYVTLEDHSSNSARSAYGQVTNTEGLYDGALKSEWTSKWSWGAFYEDNYPRTVTYYEDRIAFAGTPAEKFGIWLSRTGVYDSFEEGSKETDAEVSLADGAINQVVNAEKANTVQWISSGENLGVGTFGDEFTIGAGITGGLTQANSQAKRQGGKGSEKIRPCKMSDRLYYVQRGGRKIREYFYQWEENNYKSTDMTKYSEHITLSGIKDMDYAEVPDEVLYCVLENGKMAVFTRDADEEVMAWTPFETDGDIKSVRVIPNPAGEVDQVWAIVERTIDGNTVKYIEWFEPYVVDDSTIQYKCFYVDSGLIYDGYAATTGKDITLSALTGEDVVATDTSKSFTQDDVGKRLRVIDTTTRLMIGEMDIEEVRQIGLEAHGTVTKDFTSLSVTGGDWAVSVDEISGFDHINNEDVNVLADGAEQVELSVDGSGVIALARDAFYIVAGLPYTSRIKTNPFEYPSAETTTTTKKRITSVGVKVYKTLGITYGDGIGSQPDVRYRRAATSSGLPDDLWSGLQTNLTLDGNWDYESQVVIEQTRPLPVNILAIYANTRMGDKR